MLISKLTKEFNKLQTEEYQRPVTRVFRDCLLVTDSKGFFLSNEITRDYYGSIKIISRSGVTVDDQRFQRSLLRNIQIAIRPIVFVWFGTCELTDKVGKFISLKNNPTETVDQLIVKYRYFKSSIQRCNNSATVLFINCPYYSIVEWNRRKGCNNINQYLEQETLLHETIDYLNSNIDRINCTRTPKLCLDIIRSSKKNSSSRVKYTKNFNLYIDGVHPGKHLSLLWLHKLLKLKSTIENSDG